MLELEGITVTSTVIVGDIHSVKNKIVKDKDSILKQASQNHNLIKKIIRTYNLPINILLMSNLTKEQAYIERINNLTPLFNKSSEAIAIARNTVLQNRIPQEERSGYKYTLEEVAMITGFDIKVGPPREVHYDTLARMFGYAVNNENFVAIYLKPTYPLGLNFDFFVQHQEIETFGVTPYKAGSNKLQNNRIIIGKTTKYNLKKLINNSVTSNDLDLPNPVLDLYSTALFAEHFLTNSGFSTENRIISNQNKLKKYTFEHICEYIYKPLKLE